jgi:hypothetical protein
MRIYLGMNEITRADNQSKILGDSHNVLLKKIPESLFMVIKSVQMPEQLQIIVGDLSLAVQDESERVDTLKLLYLTSHITKHGGGLQV